MATRKKAPVKPKRADVFVVVLRNEVLADNFSSLEEVGEIIKEHLDTFPEDEDCPFRVYKLDKVLRANVESVVTLTEEK